MTDDHDELSVLICDDYEAMRVMLGVIVKGRPGLRLVGEAKDGAEAIAQAEKLQPDVIVLDLSMPKMTGLAALPQIKRVAPRTKVIVLSAFGKALLGPDSLAKGADRYLEKGALPHEIASAIEEVGRSAKNGNSAGQRQSSGLRNTSE